jgi:hypothetical protein
MPRIAAREKALLLIAILIIIIKITSICLRDTEIMKTIIPTIAIAAPCLMADADNLMSGGCD